MRGQWLSRMRGRLSGMRGQSTAEFALAVPIFLLLLFGAFEVGALLKTHAAYQEATISAARGGAAAGPDPTADGQILGAFQSVMVNGNLNTAFGAYWKVLYRVGGQGHDVTVWSLSVAGSTVHLVNP